ncbi:MAG: LLM class flavin-dependent oxidoreductase [Candidatus Heimdallarchaeota archaeon]|nr:LLM class flavin-dependent oxidoreductase [Candidatus Heimdallarchaeota archaeon]
MMASTPKFGIYIANHSISSDPNDYVDLAKLSEECGWEGFFIWDHVYTPWSADDPVLDPWVILSAIATQTENLMIGITVTPLARRRPTVLARQAASLSKLSNGRFILGVGLGGSEEFDSLGEESDPFIRAEMLDESLEILQGLWSGKPFIYEGRHYHIKEAIQFKPEAKIKIWVGGFWPHKKPFRRVAKFDGIFPLKAGSDPSIYPQDIREIIEYIRKYRISTDSFDVVKSMYQFLIKKKMLISMTLRIWE